MKKASGEWRVASGEEGASASAVIPTPDAGRRTPDAKSGLTLVEVLMSMLVTGIGVLGVVALLPLAFVRAVQATNLTNGTILRYNAESMIDINPRLLLRWQPQQAYQAGDIVLVPNSPLDGFVCTTAGTSGLVTPNWQTANGAFTTENPLTSAAPVWKTNQNPTQAPILNPPPRFVIDPLGWNALSASGLQGQLGNNGAGAVDTQAIARFNGEITSIVPAAQQVNLPDSWVEQLRAPLTSFTTTTAVLNNVDLSGVGLPPAVISRVILIDATGKGSQTRLLTGTTPASGTVSWSASDPLTGSFTPIAARIETQELRYTWMLTVIPSSGGGSSNVEVTVFFHRPLAVSDEQVFQASGVDGVQTPFTVTYGATKPFLKKGSFLFDAYFGRWYRIVNIANDTGSQVNVFVDQPRPQADVLVSPNFGAVFMRGIVDVFPLPLK